MSLPAEIKTGLLPSWGYVRSQTLYMEMETRRGAKWAVSETSHLKRCTKCGPVNPALHSLHFDCASLSGLRASVYYKLLKRTAVNGRPETCRVSEPLDIPQLVRVWLEQWNTWVRAMRQVLPIWCNLVFRSDLFVSRSDLFVSFLAGLFLDASS